MTTNRSRRVWIAAVGAGVNCSTLFDLSHGAGVLPEQWPKPLPGIRCGYAGGLSPDNIKEQLTLISAAVGDTPIWIDMETHVRSNNDRLFDLGKVEQVLKVLYDMHKAGTIQLTHYNQ